MIVKHECLLDSRLSRTRSSWRKYDIIPAPPNSAQVTRADKEQSKPRNLTVPDIKGMKDTEGKSPTPGRFKPFNNPLIPGVNEREWNRGQHLTGLGPGKSPNFSNLRN